jgi:hypothetical protein
MSMLIVFRSTNTSALAAKPRLNSTSSSAPSYVPSPVIIVAT